MQQKRNSIFMSYCQIDRKWLEKLQSMLAPLLQTGHLNIWDDTQIAPGADWHQARKNAIASAQISIVFFSPSFMASDFMMQNELPLLHSAAYHGMRILWIAVSYGFYQHTDIVQYQALNNPEKPLSAFKGAPLEKEIMRICIEIKKVVDADLVPISTNNKTTSWSVSQIPTSSTGHVPRAEHTISPLETQKLRELSVKHLTGQQYQSLVSAMIDAFPSLTRLAHMLRFKFGENINRLAMGENLQEIVFKLIEASEAGNWTMSLLMAARESNPGNEALRIYVQQLLSGNE